MTKLLVYRFSAMGDVLLTLPVLKGVLETNPELHVWFVTQRMFFPFFDNIDRLHLIDSDFKGKNRGTYGVFKLFKSLRQDIKPDRVIDIHGVLRSYLLDFFFFLSGYHVNLFNKGTFEKQSVIWSKQLKSLPSTVERYSNVFKKVGLNFCLSKPPFFRVNTLDDEKLSVFHKPVLVGIAPFAKHAQKVWGNDKIEELIRLINQNFDLNIVLFGGGVVEIDLLRKLSSIYPNCVVSADYFNLNEELGLISKLDLMVSMDSANMHLAAMAGIPVVSVWGATHPALGFAPYNQPLENVIQYSGADLKCRPCSVFGNKKCVFLDGPQCMDRISSIAVFKRIQQILIGKLAH
jgi:ADP-heptose:LPS heptosyltransferase